MFLCSSVIVGDSGMEARVGSWLTNELMLIRLTTRLQVLVRDIIASHSMFDLTKSVCKC